MITITNKQTKKRHYFIIKHLISIPHKGMIPILNRMGPIINKIEVSDEVYKQLTKLGVKVVSFNKTTKKIKRTVPMPEEVSKEKAEKLAREEKEEALAKEEAEKLAREEEEEALAKEEADKLAREEADHSTKEVPTKKKKKKIYKK